MVAQCRSKVLQNVALCNTFDLHKAIIGLENQFSVLLRVAVLHRSYWILQYNAKWSNHTGKEISLLCMHNLAVFGRYKLSRDMRTPTMWYVRQAEPQISLCIRAVSKCHIAGNHMSRLNWYVRAWQVRAAVFVNRHAVKSWGAFSLMFN